MGRRTVSGERGKKLEPYANQTTEVFEKLQRKPSAVIIVLNPVAELRDSIDGGKVIDHIINAAIEAVGAEFPITVLQMSNRPTKKESNLFLEEWERAIFLRHFILATGCSNKTATIAVGLRVYRELRRMKILNLASIPHPTAKKLKDPRVMEDTIEKVTKVFRKIIS